MFPITTSNDVMQEKGRVKSLANSAIKKKLVNNKYRRLCSINKCEKQAQRKGLCAKHLTENKNRQESTNSIAVSHQSSAYSRMEELDTISNNSSNLAALTGNHTEQNTFYDYGELFCFINLEYLKTSFICHII